MNICTHFSKKQKCVQYKSSQGHKPWRCTASNGEQITNLRRHAHSILKLSYSTVKLRLIIDWATCQSFEWLRQASEDDGLPPPDLATLPVTNTPEMVAALEQVFRSNICCIIQVFATLHKCLQRYTNRETLTKLGPHCLVSVHPMRQVMMVAERWLWSGLNSI